MLTLLEKPHQHVDYQDQILWLTEHIEENRHELLAVAARFFPRDPHRAEDALQETTLRAINYFEQHLLNKETLSGWLAKTIRNICFDFLRKKKFIPLEDIAEPFIDVPEPMQTDLPADPSLEELLQAVDREVRDAIREVLRTSPKCTEVLRLRLEGKTDQEIADALDTPLNTVKSRLHHLRTHVEKELRLVA